MLPAGADSFQYPLTQYDHAESPLDGDAVAGGFACRGRDVAALKGSHVFADLSSVGLFHVSLAGLDAALADGRIAPDETLAPRRIQLVDSEGAPVTFADVAGRGDPPAGRVDLRLAETATGELLAFSKSNGDIFRLVAAPGLDARGTPEPDRLEGTDRDDRLVGRAGADTLLGQSGDDLLTGGGGPDRLSGGRGADTLAGGNGADVLRGNRGADLLSGGAGHDRLFGGPGWDWVDYGRADLVGRGGVGVTVDLFRGRADQPGGVADQGFVDWLTGIENVIGTSGNDTFRGRGGANIFDGGDDRSGPRALGPGGDTVELFGTAEAWRFRGTPEEFTATRTGGTDRLIDMEFLRFLGDDSLIATADLDFL